MGWSARAYDADLQDVEDVGPVRRQRHELEHFDLEHVGRLDAVGGQRDLIDFPWRTHARRHRCLQGGGVIIVRLLAAADRQHRGQKDEG